mmetsp:Transcript_14232/g.24205  ORF Transcript_14232/g.24205 Transcript_14232/m.24205 type:complete len:274 (-) Transcript_14232:430-1251(-)
MTLLLTLVGVGLGQLGVPAISEEAEAPLFSAMVDGAAVLDLLLHWSGLAYCLDVLALLTAPSPLFSLPGRWKGRLGLLSDLRQRVLGLAHEADEILAEVLLLPVVGAGAPPQGRRLLAFEDAVVVGGLPVLSLLRHLVDHLLQPLVPVLDEAVVAPLLLLLEVDSVGVGLHEHVGPLLLLTVDVECEGVRLRELGLGAEGEVALLHQLAAALDEVVLDDAALEEVELPQLLIIVPVPLDQTALEDRLQVVQLVIADQRRVPLPRDVQGGDELT